MGILEGVFTLVYMFVFFMVLRKSNEIEKECETEVLHEKMKKDFEIENEEAVINLNFTFENFKTSVKPMGKVVFHISLVNYFLVYKIN